MSKLFLLLLLSISSISCNIKPRQDEAAKDETNTVVNFDWLLGEWQRVNEKEDRATYEYWHKVSSDEYAGLGFTIKDGDTLQQEQIKLQLKGRTWALIVKTTADGDEVLFKMSAQTDSSFICENITHDFPTEIKYWIEGAQLNASVSGGEMVIPFVFERLKQ